MAREGRVTEAYQLLSSPEAECDPDALFTLAVWRLSGRLIRRDLAQARYFFGRAAEAGHTQAAEIHIAFIANGTGGDADWRLARDLLDRYTSNHSWARAQAHIIEGMPLTPAGDPLEIPEAVSLSQHPWVQCIRSLLSPDECAFLIESATPWLVPAHVIDPSTGRHVQDPVRTADGMSFPLIAENLVVHAVNRRVAAATGTSVSQGEPLQILRYRAQQEYRPHMDAIANDANPRILTTLLYLNAGYTGGGTLFVRTGLQFRGEPGDALVFRNVLTNGAPDKQALHAGQPVRAGEKLIGSRWIRAKPFSLPAPQPVIDV